MAETSLIKCVAIHATASTSAPASASKGSSISQATYTAAGFVTLGSRKLFSNDCDLNDDNFGPTFLRTYEDVVAPRNMGVEDHLLVELRAEPFEFTCYDGSQTLLNLDSNLSSSSVTVSMTATVTKRTVMVEIQGLGYHYFPSCIVAVTGEEGGFASGGIAKVKLKISPEQTAGLSGGWKKVYYA